MVLKISAATTAALMLVSTIAASWQPAYAEPDAAEAPPPTSEAVAEEAAPRVIRTIEATEDDLWQVVDIRQVRGKLVVVSPAVGREIDLEESNRYSLFQGRTVYNRRYAIPLFDMAVAGFQGARFLKRDDGRTVVTVAFRSGKRILTRTMPIRDEGNLRRLREYIEHFDEIQDGTYQLERESKVPEDADFPAVSEEVVSYEDRVPRFRIIRRVPGSVVLKDGEEVSGELVPAYTDGRIMVQTKLDARWIDVGDIERLRIQGERGSAAVGTAVRAGFGGAASGAAVGALAAWQADGDVKRTAIMAAIIFGAVGFVTGLLTGARQGRPGREFVMGPVASEDGPDEDRASGPRPR